MYAKILNRNIETEISIQYGISILHLSCARQLFNNCRADPGSISKLFLLITDAYVTYAEKIETVEKWK